MSTVLDQKTLTVTEAAKELKISGARVRQLIASGQLTAELVHPRLLAIRRESLDAFKKIERPRGLHADKRPAEKRQAPKPRGRRSAKKRS